MRSQHSSLLGFLRRLGITMTLFLTISAIQFVSCPFFLYGGLETSLRGLLYQLSSLSLSLPGFLHVCMQASVPYICGRHAAFQLPCRMRGRGPRQ